MVIYESVRESERETIVVLLTDSMERAIILVEKKREGEGETLQRAII